MPYAGLIAFTIIAVAIANAKRIRHWWRKGCDRCRLEDIGHELNPEPKEPSRVVRPLLGAAWSHTPHTCFPWRNPYKDRNGDIWEFGRKVGGQIK